MLFSNTESMNDMDKNPHYTFDRYDAEMKPQYKPKKGFKTEIEAVFRCYQLNLLPHSIHKAVAYKCPKCGMWHIGHNNITLTDKRREQIRVDFKHFKKVHGFKC